MPPPKKSWKTKNKKKDKGGRLSCLRQPKKKPFSVTQQKINYQLTLLNLIKLLREIKKKISPGLDKYPMGVT